MLSYLSKFILQMLPTISATVIGAYIVSTWISPKTPPEHAKLAARASDAKPADREVRTRHEGLTEQAGDSKPVEVAPPVKSATMLEKVRIIPIAKPASTPGENASVTAASSPAPAADAAAADERKEARRDASELARAAILRLRGSEAARTADEPPRPAASATRVQSSRGASDGAPATAGAVPPLPPAVSIASPRISGERDDHAVAVPERIVPERINPPAEIPPARDPLNIQASAGIPDAPSLADDFLTATKTFFRAITP